MLGFAFAGPLIALLAITALQLTAVIWQRELAAAELQRAVSMAARLNADRVTLEAGMARRLKQLRIAPESVRWSETLTGRRSLLTGQLSVNATGLGALPELRLEVSASAAME